MKTTDTQDLLQAFTREHSEVAFQELVNRYIDLVYSAAIRRVDGNTQLAEDVTQQVFTDLARKAEALPTDLMLGGWLHRHTGFVASTAMRGEQRRRNRERLAVEMNALNESSEANWKQLAPMLDEAMDELDTADRDALVLRYFERRELRAVGAALGVSDDTAQKRVSRAVEKLRELLAKRGSAMFPVAVLSLLLGIYCVQAAPAGLGPRIGKAALKSTAAAGGAGVLAGLLNLLAPTTAKLAIGVVVAALVTAGLLHYSAGRRKETSGPQSVGTVSEMKSKTPMAGAAPHAPQAEPLTAQAQTATPNTNTLHLVILAEDTGQPVPNAKIDYRGWQKGKFKGQTFNSDRAGICNIPVPRQTITDLELTTRIDGFADTRLHWRPDNGEQIPASYTLRLTRPVAIGGLVVDADGQPVADAKVGFNHEDEPVSLTLPESHEFSWIEVSTDATGHWSIDRVAPEMIHRVYGSAKHPQHVQSEMMFASRDRETEQQLLAGTYTFHLGRPVTVRGVVVDPAGSPVAGANVLVGKRGMSDSRQAKSTADGSFEVAGCRPGKSVLTAEAKEFSATTMEVELKTEFEPFRITLQRGKVLRLRVVSSEGQPIPKASIWLDTMHHRPINAPDYGTTTVQANFNKSTDGDGRMVWSNAPDAKLEFDIAAGGYMRTNQVPIPADGEEHIITLSSAVTVSGTVRDADTGELIPRFRIVTGWPEKTWGPPVTNSGVPRPSVQGHWTTIERYWVNYEGGKFRHVLEEPAIYGTENPGYMLKIEAEDYAPFISRAIAADEGKVQLDVTLQKSKSALVTVVLPDGFPAAGADIGLVSPGAQLRLAPGGFSRQTGSGEPSLLRTDGDGHFRLSGDPAVIRVIAAHSAGYATATPTALIEKPILTLQPWGKLEGTYSSGGQPAADREMTLAFTGADAAGVSFDFMTFVAKTDEQGHFVFPQVPPGKFKIARRIHIPPNGWSEEALSDGDVDIRSGETTTVALGGTGYTVKARVRWPDDVQPGKGWNLFVSLFTAPPPAVWKAQNDPAARAALENSPEVQNYQRTARHFRADIADDYTIVVENIPAGDYAFMAMASPQTPGEHNGALSCYSPTLTVPSDPPAGTLDAGEILLRKPALADAK